MKRRCSVSYIDVLLKISPTSHQLQVTSFSMEVMRLMAPLILISLFNILSGLSGTKR